MIWIQLPNEAKWSDSLNSFKNNLERDWVMASYIRLVLRLNIEWLSFSYRWYSIEVFRGYNYKFNSVLLAILLLVIKRSILC